MNGSRWILVALLTLALGSDPAVGQGEASTRLVIEPDRDPDVASASLTEGRLAAGSVVALSYSFHAKIPPPSYCSEPIRFQFALDSAAAGIGETETFPETDDRSINDDSLGLGAPSLEERRIEAIEFQGVVRISKDAPAFQPIEVRATVAATKDPTAAACNVEMPVPVHQNVSFPVDYEPGILAAVLSGPNPDGTLSIEVTNVANGATRVSFEWGRESRAWVPAGEDLVIEQRGSATRDLRWYQAPLDWDWVVRVTGESAVAADETRSDTILLRIENPNAENDAGEPKSSSVPAVGFLGAACAAMVLAGIVRRRR